MSLFGQMSEFAGHETINAMSGAELTVPDHHHHHHNGVGTTTGAGDVAAMIENFQNKKTSGGGGTAAMLNRINANSHGPSVVLSTADGVNGPSAQVVSSSSSSSRVKRSSQVGI